MRAQACVAAVVVSLLSQRAEADVSKAWAAAKDNLPANTRMVAAIDVAAIVKTASFAKVFEAVLKGERDLGQGYSMIKAACKFDPVTVVEGIVIAGDPDGNQAVFMLQLSADRAKVVGCIEAALKAANEKPQIKADGIFTAVNLGNDTLHLAWVTKDVVAMSMDPEKKESLQAWIGQKGVFGKARVAAQVAKADTKALAWGAFAFDKPLDDNDAKGLLAGYGAVTLDKGALAGAIKATFTSAKLASAAVTKAKQELAEEAADTKTPEAARKVLKAINLSAAGSEATLKGSVSVEDFLGALAAAMQ